jgi:hypothetical protein
MLSRRRPDILPPPRPSFSITKRPKSKIAIFCWRRRIWLESTFALTIYEPWEKVIVGQPSFFFLPIGLLRTMILCFERSDDLCGHIHCYTRWFAQVSPSSLDSDAETRCLLFVGQRGNGR